MTKDTERPRVLSVLVADDERSVVDVLEALIGGEEDLRLVGSAADADGAIATAVSELPDVARLDVRMPGGGGLRAAREIARRCPSTRVIALTAHEDEETVIAMMAAGAHAYVPKGESTERILREIHRHPGAAGDAPARAVASSGGSVWGTTAPVPSGPGSRRREQRARVQDVIDRGAVRPAFQPIVDLGSGGMVGVEALARFARLPVRGPDAWFAEAETVGMLALLEATVIRSALERLPEIPSSAFLSINVSPAVIDSDEIQDAFAAAPAERIVVELSEHTRVADYAGLDASLAPMRARGFRVAIDDVGAGLSRLRHVVMLAPDLVKIDSALTNGIDHDPTRHAVVAALADCTAQLGALAVAEGVGGLEEVEALLAVGVPLAQAPLSVEAGSLDAIDLARALNIRGRNADSSRSTTSTVRKPGKGA
jgi:EAL domain-containing protein (putative c-di-GMP-specific phosphodiesterase class I)/ActR/RegA family two-component response regulator